MTFFKRNNFHKFFIAGMTFLFAASCQKYSQDVVDCNIYGNEAVTVKIDKWSLCESDVMPDSLQCHRSLLDADVERRMFLFSQRAVGNRYILNGDTLELKRFEQQNYYPVFLKEGINELIAITDTASRERHISLELCDSVIAIRLMAESMFGRMFYTLINPDSMMLNLDMKYRKVMPLESSMEIFDVVGRKIHELKITDDNLRYELPALEVGKSYMSKWTIGESSTWQTFLCGDPDKVYEMYRNRFDSVRISVADSLEIDQLLWRFRFLLEHPSRKDDWWWQFKIAPIAYQLEYAFRRMEGEDGIAPTLNFESYNSRIDGMVQRCVVFTPKDMTRHYPLVVMIRPNEENRHEFFSCPQLARQWAVNNVQMLCDKYGLIVMMPEGRMRSFGLLDEDNEREIMNAIDFVKKKYPVEDGKVYLHANCSGGERALQLASHHPDKFNGMGLYAPFFSRLKNEKYPDKIQIKLENLKGMPIFVHGDPLDGHSPPIFYKDLINGMDKVGNPCKVSMEYHSGELYNVTIVGEEALQYFKQIE